MATTTQSPSGKKSNGCGVALLVFTILFGVMMFWVGYGEEISDRFGIVLPWSAEANQDPETGLPKGVHLIEFYGGVDPETATDEEVSAGMQRARAELVQALYDMETGFYIDSPALLMGSETVPADVFWVGEIKGTSARTDKGKKLYYRVDVTYLCSKQERDRMQAEIDEAAADIIAQVPADADRWTKALVVHDELVKRMSYDYSYSNEHRFDIYGALVEHEAVCAGYARAFEYLMESLGERAEYDTSSFHPNEEGISHAWNHTYGTESVLVYYIDVTWDDSGSVDRFGNPYILHDYFGLALAELSRIDSHQGLALIDDDRPYSEASYHVKKGYFLESYDRSALIGIFEEQYDDGSNLLTVKFADEEAYLDAMEALCGAGWRDWDDADTSELWTVLRAAAPGYDEGISIGHNDGLYILNIYLYPA